MKCHVLAMPFSKSLAQVLNYNINSTTSKYIRSNQSPASFLHLHGAVATSRPLPLESTHQRPGPFLYEIWQISDGVAMRDKIPASCSISVIIEPRAKDEIGSNSKEDATTYQQLLHTSSSNIATHMIKSHVNQPQCPEVLLAGLCSVWPSQAYLVFQFNRSTPVVLSPSPSCL